MTTLERTARSTKREVHELPSNPGYRALIKGLADAQNVTEYKPPTASKRLTACLAKYNC